MNQYNIEESILIYDLGRKKVIREYWKYYYERLNALIYVIDASNEDRIEECHVSLQEILKDEKVVNIPILFLGNKNDLSNLKGLEEIIEKMELDDIKGRYR